MTGRCLPSGSTRLTSHYKVPNALARLRSVGRSNSHAIDLYMSITLPVLPGLFLFSALINNPDATSGLVLVVGKP